MGSRRPGRVHRQSFIESQVKRVHKRNGYAVNCQQLTDYLATFQQPRNSPRMPQERFSFYPATLLLQNGSSSLLRELARSEFESLSRSCGVP